MPFEILKLRGQILTREWILAHFDALDPNRFGGVEAKALRFCGQWLAGTEEFQVQTSGSTGKPKTISLNRRQMALSARLTGQALDLKDGDQALVCLSPFHIGGVMMLVRGLELGLEMTFVPPCANPLACSDLSPSAHFDFSAMVPLQLQTILHGGRRHEAMLSRMKAILVGGAPVSEALVRLLRRIRSPVYQTFGMTETVSHIALRRLNGPSSSPEYKVLPGVQIGQDARGCLTIRSPLTNGQVLVSNDLVELKSDSRFVWLGRLDNVINSGGVKVRAEKVEQAIAEVLEDSVGRVDSNIAFLVAGVPDTRLGEKVVAVFEAPEFTSPDQAEMLTRLSHKLAKYELPKALLFVPALVRAANGKIDRRATLKRLLPSKSHS